MYIPKSKFIYPMNQDQHMIRIIQKRYDVLDCNYQYVNKSFLFKFKKFWFNVLFYCFAVPLARVRYHLRVEGKKKLKEYKKIAKQSGIITVSNHICMWDYILLRSAIRFKHPYVPIWEKNNTTGLAGLIRLVGGIPIPSNLGAFKTFHREIDKILDDKCWLHIYSEQSMWYYYVPIRDFKKGSFYFACRHNIPVLPISYSYREPKGLFKHHKSPFITMHIGDLKYPDMSLNKDDMIEKVKNDTRKEIMMMCGIENEEQNMEIAKKYYTYENGHLYKDM